MTTLEGLALSVIEIIGNGHDESRSCSSITKLNLVSVSNLNFDTLTLLASNRTMTIVFCLSIDLLSTCTLLLFGDYCVSCSRMVITYKPSIV